MTKKPDATTGNPEDNNPYDRLEDDHDKLYVDMAVQGYHYLHISKKAQVTHQSVRRWFMTGGRLHDAYKYRLKQHREEYRKKFKEIDQLIKDGAVDAVLKLIEAVQSSGVWPTHIMAAKDLLSRAGFDATDKVEATVSQKTDTAVVDAARKIQEYAKTGNASGS